MIEVTRLNDTKISVNPLQLEFLEETPDTVLVFNSSHRMVVKEKASEIRSLCADFYAEVMRRAEGK